MATRCTCPDRVSMAGVVTYCPKCDRPKPGAVRRIWRGMKGHAGTETMLMMLVLGALAGSSRGSWGAVVGAAVMLAVFGPLYLIGAWANGGKDGE